MNPLLPHIVYLLRRHDCVIIPSLGAFIVGRRPAMLDAAAGKFYPPMKEVMFNASIVNNDGLLANSLARRQRISYQEGLQIVGDAAARMRERLMADKRLRLSALGILTLGPEGNIVFSPEETPAQGAARRGLRPVDLRGADAEEVAATEIDEPRQIRDSRYYYFRVRKSAMRVAASIVAVIILAVAGMYFPESSVAPEEIRQEQASVIPVPKPDSAVTPMKQEAKTTVADSAKYHIVVGAFTDADEARRFLDRHAGKGFDLRIVRSRKFIHITADRGDDRDALFSKMNSHPLDTTFRNPWIMKR